MILPVFVEISIGKKWFNMMGWVLVVLVVVLLLVNLTVFIPIKYMRLNECMQNCK